MLANIKSIVNRIASSPSRRVLLFGAVDAVLVNTLGILLGFGLQYYLAKLMSPKEFGLFTYIQAWLLVVVLFSTLGFESALLRFISTFKAKSDWPRLSGILRKSDSLCLISSATVTIFGTIFLYFFVPDTQLAAASILALGCVPIITLIFLRQSTLRALKRIIFSRAPDMLVRPVLFVLLLTVVDRVFGFEISAINTIALALLVYLILLIINSLLVKASLPKEVATVVPHFETNMWLSVSVPLMMVSAAQMLLNNVDTIMVGFYDVIENVGVYAIASKIGSVVLFGIQAINTIAAPMIAEYHYSKSKEELQSLVTTVAMWIFITSTPLVFLILLFGGYILSLFGPHFASGYPALVFILVGQLINISLGPVGFLLNMTGHHNKSLRVLLICLVINVALNLPAIRYFGITGAAAATGFSIALRNILMWIAARDLIGVDASVYGVIKKVFNKFMRSNL